MSMYHPPDPKSYNALVWEIVKQIPSGSVSTYGQIASMIPPPEAVDPGSYTRLGPRWVGSAMRETPDDSIPWQRVINSQGKISPRGPGDEGDMQRARLEMEGVRFDGDRVRFEDFGWDGPDSDWLRAHNLMPPRPLRKKKPPVDDPASQPPLL